MAVLYIKDASGNFIPVPSIKGADGYTPVRGIDYWTEQDLKEIQDLIDESKGEVEKDLKDLRKSLTTLTLTAGQGIAIEEHVISYNHVIKINMYISSPYTYYFNLTLDITTSNDNVFGINDVIQYFTDNGYTLAGGKVFKDVTGVFNGTPVTGLYYDPTTDIFRATLTGDSTAGLSFNPPTTIVDTVAPGRDFENTISLDQEVKEDIDALKSTALYIDEEGYICLKGEE